MNDLWVRYYANARVKLRKAIENLKVHRATTDVGLRSATKKKRPEERRRCLVILDMFCGLQVPGGVVAKVFLNDKEHEHRFLDVYLVSFDLLSEVNSQGPHHEHVCGDLLCLDEELVLMLRNKFPDHAEVRARVRGQSWLGICCGLDMHEFYHWSHLLVVAFRLPTV